MTALLELGAGVGWPDLEAAGAARSGNTSHRGRLSTLVEWLSSTQGGFPPHPPRRARCLVLGPVADETRDLAGSLEVGLHGVDLPGETATSFAAGAAEADRAVDEGVDLIVLAGQDDGPAAPAVVSLLTGAEPVALLPRGADAIDTERWIARAGALRGLRRRVAALRDSPDELLSALGSPVLAAAAGLALRAAARRTGVVLDGTAVLAAALLCVDIQTKAREWWQIADTSRERADARVVDRLELHPLLDLGAGDGSGCAGLLAVAVLRAAAITGMSRD